MNGSCLFPDICQMPKDFGPCNGFVAVWYFEPNSKTCRRFAYGGCGGNGNRFENREDCESKCLNKKSTPGVPSTTITTTASTPEAEEEKDGECKIQT